MSSGEKANLIADKVDSNTAGAAEATRTKASAIFDRNPPNRAGSNLKNRGRANPSLNGAETADAVLKTINRNYFRASIFRENLCLNTR